MTLTRPAILDGLLPRTALTPGEREEMFRLLTEHFDGVTREQFEHDLAEKNWVVQIRRDGQLLGFTTLLVEKVDFESEAITALYSGDTIMSPAAWKSPALARAWIAAVNHLRSAHPARRCYWLLLTSGFRTYRFLPVFWREFFPRDDAPTPAFHQRLLHDLAARRYGKSFDAQRGIVQFPHPQQLRGGLCSVPEGREQDAHIAFFLAKNPGHAEGDELVCLTEIHETNLTPAGRRMIAPVPR